MYIFGEVVTLGYKKHCPKHFMDKILPIFDQLNIVNIYI